MKRLVVDDLRVLDFEDSPIYARSLEMGMHLALTEPWDELYLDHDLGFNSTVRPLVTALEEQAALGDPAPIARIFIITGNPVGANWIYRALHEHYVVKHIPFIHAGYLELSESLDCVEIEKYQLERIEDAS